MKTQANCSRQDLDYVINLQFFFSWSKKCTLLSFSEIFCCLFSSCVQCFGLTQYFSFSEQSILIVHNDEDGGGGGSWDRNGAETPN